MTEMMAGAGELTQHESEADRQQERATESKWEEEFIFKKWQWDGEKTFNRIIIICEKANLLISTHQGRKKPLFMADYHKKKSFIRGHIKISSWTRCFAVGGALYKILFFHMLYMYYIKFQQPSVNYIIWMEVLCLFLCVTRRGSSLGWGFGWSHSALDRRSGRPELN